MSPGWGILYELLLTRLPPQVGRGGKAAVPWISFGVLEAADNKTERHGQHVHCFKNILSIFHDHSTVREISLNVSLAKGDCLSVSCSDKSCFKIDYMFLVFFNVFMSRLQCIVLKSVFDI